MPKFLLPIILLFVTCSLKAQTWEFGGGVGGTGYIGDLNPNNPLAVSGFSGGAFVKYNFDGYLSAKVAYNVGSISANDANSSNAQFQARNINFTTSLYEASAVCEFNFMEYIPSVSRSRFTPYLYAGFAAVSYFPTAVLNGVTYDLRGYVTEGQKKAYPTTAFSIPYGFGIKYNIGGALTLGAELGYRNPNTDYLDDVSGNYPEKALNHNSIEGQLSDPSGVKTGVYIGTPGTQRGDGRPRDTYFFTQITLSFTFITSKCYFHN